MTAIDENPPAHARGNSPLPALWHEPAPPHFDQAIPWWIKAVFILIATIVAILWLDYPIAHWALTTHPIPDLADPLARHNDVARELMLLEQWGQWVSSVLVIVAVALIDKAGRRRALAISIGCLFTVLVCYLLKDLFGRTRPYVLHTGVWIWGGPTKGFTQGSAWGAFPSAHTTGAFALSVGLSWFYPRARGLFMAIAVITSGQRVLHSFHYLSDVFSGMGIAILITRWTLQKNLAGRLLQRLPPRARDWFFSV